MYGNLKVNERENCSIPSKNVSSLLIIKKSETISDGMLHKLLVFHFGTQNVMKTLETVH